MLGIWEPYSNNSDCLCFKEKSVFMYYIFLIDCSKTNKKKK